MHRLRVSAWPGDVYLKSYLPSCTFLGYIPGLGPRDCAKSAMGSAVVGVHRHHESAIPTLLAPCGGRVIHRTFRKRSLCVNGSRAFVSRSRRPVWSDRGAKCAKSTPFCGVRASALGSGKNRSRSASKMALLSASGAQNQGCTQKTYNVVGYILDALFLTTLTSAVYANSSSQQL